MTASLGYEPGAPPIRRPAVFDDPLIPRRVSPFDFAAQRAIWIARAALRPAYRVILDEAPPIFEFEPIWPDEVIPSLEAPMDDDDERLAWIAFCDTEQAQEFGKVLAQKRVTVRATHYCERCHSDIYKGDIAVSITTAKPRGGIRSAYICFSCDGHGAYGTNPNGTKFYDETQSEALPCTA